LFCAVVAPGEPGRRHEISRREQKKKNRESSERKCVRARRGGRWTRVGVFEAKTVVRLEDDWHRRREEKKRDLGTTGMQRVRAAGGMRISGAFVALQRSQGSVSRNGHSLQALREAPSGATRACRIPYSARQREYGLGGPEEGWRKRVGRPGGTMELFESGIEEMESFIDKFAS
jgi:hypothetical protein